MAIPFMPLALSLVFLVGLMAGVYAVSLWTKLSRLEHEVEHQGLWEALHHHEHDFRGRMRS
jgi:hypothetical protein